MKKKNTTVANMITTCNIVKKKGEVQVIFGISFKFSHNSLISNGKTQTDFQIVKWLQNLGRSTTRILLSMMSIHSSIGMSEIVKQVANGSQLCMRLTRGWYLAYSCMTNDECLCQKEVTSRFREYWRKIIFKEMNRIYCQCITRRVECDHTIPPRHKLDIYEKQVQSFLGNGNKWKAKYAFASFSEKRYNIFSVDFETWCHSIIGMTWVDRNDFRIHANN